MLLYFFALCVFFKDFCGPWSFNAAIDAALTVVKPQSFVVYQLSVISDSWVSFLLKSNQIKVYLLKTHHI